MHMISSGISHHRYHRCPHLKDRDTHHPNGREIRDGHEEGGDPFGLQEGLQGVVQGHDQPGGDAGDSEPRQPVQEPLQMVARRKGDHRGIGPGTQAPAHHSRGPSHPASQRRGVCHPPKETPKGRPRLLQFDVDKNGTYFGTKVFKMERLTTVVGGRGVLQLHCAHSIEI